MDIFDNLLNGIVTVAQPANLLLLLAGVLMGMVVGILPGLGPTAGLAILLPVTFALDPTGAVIMLAAVYYGSMYGGTITSVLINTPGEAATVATTFDGYPLAKLGRAGAALVTAAVASFVAGTLGTVLLTFLAPLMSGIASNFGPPEILAVITLGLLLVVFLISDNWIKGLISLALGLLIATVGIDVGSGSQRFTFGSPDLISGIDFVPIAIGLFGLAEIIYQIMVKQSEQRLELQPLSLRGSGFWPTRTEWRESSGPIGRGSLLGFLLGLAPGAGATVASLLSYNLERGLSKTPERFGKGAIAGVAAPEAANNGASSGNMVPLLTLGIPGSATTAVLLGGFLLWGLQPGPLLLEQEPEFAWGLIASMYLGNVMLLLVNIFLIPVFAKIARVPFWNMAPVVVILCVFSTYSLNGSMLEVLLMVIAAVVGVCFRLYGFSSAALVIGLVLGGIFEETLRQTMQVTRGNLHEIIARPTVAVIVVISVVLLTLPIVLRVWRKRRNLELEIQD